MNNLYTKILVVLILFLGESLAIYAEMVAARTHSISSQPFLQIFLKVFLIIIVGSGLLVAGYMQGFKAFKNIWIVSVISITCILIMEPILAWTIFRQTPTKGALVGLILGALGFVSALFL